MQYKSIDNRFNNSRFVKDFERDLFFNFFQNKNKIAIISHIDPDGDALASIASIHFICKLLSIQTKIFLFNNPPYLEYNAWDLNLLPLDNFIQNEFDGIFFVDTPSLERSGLKKETKIIKPSFCIDHHIDNKFFCDFNIVAPKFCSASEIIYNLIEDSDLIIKDDDPTKNSLIINLLENLFMGILFDTYYFQTENVDYILLERAAKLQERTGSMHKLKNILFKNQNPIIYQLWGNILSTISLFYENKVVIARANAELFAKFKNLNRDFAPIISTEGFINHLMSLRNVSIAIFIREFEDEIKVSIRSSIKAASILANQFGGGGHANAAAFKISKNRYSNIEELEKDILKTIERERLLSLE